MHLITHNLPAVSSAHVTRASNQPHLRRDLSGAGTKSKA